MKGAQLWLLQKRRRAEVNGATSKISVCTLKEYARKSWLTWGTGFKGKNGAHSFLVLLKNIFFILSSSEEGRSREDKMIRDFIVKERAMSKLLTKEKSELTTIEMEKGEKKNLEKKCGSKIQKWKKNSWYRRFLHFVKLIKMGKYWRGKE